jgi:hypothetical protein
MKKEMLEKVLSGEGIPAQYKLSDKEVQIINLVERDGMSLKEAGIKMGYKSYPVPNAKRFQKSAMSKLQKAINYLMKK